MKVIYLFAVTVLVVLAGTEFIALRAYRSESIQTVGTVIDVETASATIEFLQPDGARETARLQMAGRAGSKRYRLGDRVDIYQHLLTKEVRKASFFAFWFNSILYLVFALIPFVLLFRKDAVKV